MLSSLWSRRINVPHPVPRRRARRRSVQVQVELLEDRCLLSSPGSTFTTGPLVLLSNPDPLAHLPPGPRGAGVMTEPYVTVNPANPKNIAAIWIDDGYAGNVAGVTFDGGQTWRNVAIPGLTQDTGGSNQTVADPWISFAPNGDLYSSGISFPEFANSIGQILINKSTDGGLTWSNPVQVSTVPQSMQTDKPSITADPTNSSFVYATWAEFHNSAALNGNVAQTMFARSTDGGQTWQPAQDIHDASGTDFNWGHQVVVLPDGTVIDAFTEGSYNGSHQAAVTLLRSTDHGQTWSAPIRAPFQEPLLDSKSNPPNATVADPNTGQGVEAHPMFASVAVDRTSGNLYAVWIDARFSNFQHNSIAFSMSTDGGFTWSQPIQANQTPTNVPSIDQQAWNPTVAVSANGTVAVTYYDFRNNTGTGGALTDYWMAFAPAPATNPSTWSEVRLTDTSFNLEQAPTRLHGDFWLGDYEGLAAAGNDFVAVWGMPDGSATNQESIFFRRVIDPPVAIPSLAAQTGMFAAPTQTQLAAATPPRGETPGPPSTASPPVASSPPSNSSIDPEALSVALSLSQLPATQAALLMPSFTSNLAPASPVDSSHTGSTAEAESDRSFANLDSGLPLALLVDDLALIGGSSDDLTAGNPPG